MKQFSLGIVSDGNQRMCEAIEAQVRRKYEEQMAIATGYWQKIAVEEAIDREVRERIKAVATPYSLWIR